MGRTSRALISAALLVALPLAASPFDDDFDTDAEILERRSHLAQPASDRAPSHHHASRLRVAHLDSGRQWRGGQAQVAMLIDGLARHGVESLLLAREAPLIERVRSRGVPCCSWSPRGDWDVPTLARVARWLSIRKPDVVHCHDARSHALGVPAARLAGVPAVMVSRRVTFRIGGNPLSALKYRMGVDRYLCVSQAVADGLRDAGVPECRIVIVPDAVELQATQSVDLRAMLGLPDETPLVGTVAALTPEKGHADLLEAAACVVRAAPRTHFVWMGEGRCRPALERQRARLGLDSHVHLLGHRTDAQSLLAQCTLCALASRDEGLGTSLIEAQGLGVPVVATAVGGTCELIQDARNGRLVPVGNPEAMAEAVLEAMARPDLRECWSAAGICAASAFSVERMTERTLAEYLAVLRGETTATPVA